MQSPEPGVAAAWQEAIEPTPADPNGQAEAFRVRAALAWLDALKLAAPSPLQPPPAT